MARNSQGPSFTEERAFEALGYRYIAGIDEVGRGALAGPVAAAAVILPTRIRGSWLKQVRDSKQLTPQKREVLFVHIKKSALAVGVGIVDCRTVDELGIAGAVKQAMKKAVDRLSPEPEVLLIDYLRLPDIKLPQKSIIHGDALCLSIACASIIAKVTRDRIMVEFDTVYRGYGLARHKGYGTAEHLKCLSRLGACAAHRRSFRPVRDFL